MKDPTVPSTLAAEFRIELESSPIYQSKPVLMDSFLRSAFFSRIPLAFGILEIIPLR